MALPWLESPAVWGSPPKKMPDSSEAPLRFAVMFAGNGFHGQQWWAEGAGKEMKLGEVLTTLADYRDQPHRKMCSLYLSLLDKFGVSLDRFGDSTERLANI